MDELDQDYGSETNEDPQEHAQEKNPSLEKLMQFADSYGDMSSLLTPAQLATLGKDVVEDFERDYASNEYWRTCVERALEAAAQEGNDKKTYPWDGASNVKYPSLTVAAQQFAARAYPAIVKGDEAVGFKVLGKKPDPQDQQTEAQTTGQVQGEEPQNTFGLKEERAERVKDWLNYRLFYGMPDWESDVDVMLNQLPIIGMAYKKIHKDPFYGVVSSYVSALHVTVHCDTKNLDTCPRITHDYTLYPYQIMQGIAAGQYIDISKELTTEEDDQEPMVILEQHRMHDLDDDGVEEPYIITVHKESQAIMRIEAAYNRQDVRMINDKVVGFVRFNPFIPFPFMPDPKGRWNGIGFGRLLEQINEAINSSINQLLDAGHAQNAGGGFIASGLRIQGGGQTSTLRFKPSEYKVVASNAGDLRGQIFERTVPQPSPILFQLLGMLIDSSKDISAVKDVLTGEANTNAPVGTTMAIIEQGLQQFTAIYKRIYRSLKQEFKMLYQCEGRWGGQEAAQAYKEFFDEDPNADFEKDFEPKGYDIVPVSDPTVITKAQQLAKAQFAMQFLNAPFANGPEIMKYAMETAGIDDVERFLMAQQGPSPEQQAQMQAELDKVRSETDKNKAQAVKSMADAGAVTGHHEIQGAINAGHAVEQGRLSDLAATSSDQMDTSQPQDSGPTPETGMGQTDMGPEPIGGGQPDLAAGDAG